jgi:hypothetical protein
MGASLHEKPDTTADRKIAQTATGKARLRGRKEARQDCYR